MYSEDESAVLPRGHCLLTSLWLNVSEINFTITHRPGTVIIHRCLYK